MKNYLISVFVTLLLVTIPYWSGQTLTRFDVVKPIYHFKKVNPSLFEFRLEHNIELLNLSESFEMRNILIDSILTTRETQIDQYRNLLGYLESRNTYVIDNGYYIGAYQFGDEALRNIGLGHITRAKFLKNPKIFPDSLQDWAVIELAMNNQKLMMKHVNLNNYVGKKIHGIRVTKGGILAAAHLIGWYDCYNYLSSYGNFNPKDGNGTTATDYMKKFQDKDIVAFDIENDFSHDLKRIWVENNLPSYQIDKEEDKK